MNAEYSVPLFKRIKRAILQVLIGILFRVLGQVKISGKENIPAKGSYMLVFNHVSMFDAPFIIAFWPIAIEILGAAELWGRRGQDVVVRLYAPIPIHRGEIDRDALGMALEALRSGAPLMISPEGGRSHQPGMRRAKAGVVYLAERTGVPILPVGVTGTLDDFFTRAKKGARPEVQLLIGKPFSLPEDSQFPGVAPRDVRQAKADYILYQVAALLPPEYRGVYAVTPPAAGLPGQTSTETD